jgi:hypothetical protein
MTSMFDEYLHNNLLEKVATLKMVNLKHDSGFKLKRKEK